MSNMNAFVEGMLDETREEINRADSKANILLTGVGVAVAVLGGALLERKVSLNRAAGIVQVLAVTAGLAVAVGIVFLGLAVTPRIGRGIPGRARYFMDHAQYDDLDKFRQALEYEVTRPAERHLQQLNHLSKTVRRKYRLTQAGQAAVAIGISSALAAAILHHCIG